jgi:hypothetical protein
MAEVYGRTKPPTHLMARDGKKKKVRRGPEV